MPQIDHEHYPLSGTTVPDFVGKAVVENQAAAFLPGAGDSINAQRTILGYVDPQVTAHAQVIRSGVRCDVCFGVKHREVNNAEATQCGAVGLDDGDGLRTQRAVALVLSAPLVEQQVGPPPGPTVDRSTVTVDGPTADALFCESGTRERTRFGGDLVGYCLEITHKPELPRVMPRRGSRIRVVDQRGLS